MYNIPYNNPCYGFPELSMMKIAVPRLTAVRSPSRKRSLPTTNNCNTHDRCK